MRVWRGEMRVWRRGMRKDEGVEGKDEDEEGRMYGNSQDSSTEGQYNPKEFCTIPWDTEDSWD